MYTYLELNDKSFEELTKIRDSIMENIIKNEEKRQSLIQNIQWLQNCNDLYSARNGVFGIKPCHCEANKIDKGQCQSHCELTREGIK